MATAGFPGAFQGGYTTGNLSIGAAQLSNGSSAAFPGAFQGGYTTGYLNIGAVQKAVVVVSSLIKTVNGLAIASVKTVNGLAIASLKTFNGLTNV
jgi:hypothetical protein